MDPITHRSPDGIYAPTGDYAHAIELRRPERIVYTAGTMGLEPDGAPGAGLERQLELIWDNIRAILAAADMTVDNIVRLTSYLREASFAGPNAVARQAALGGRVVPTTAIVAQTLSEDWLVEIEVIAAA
jgi:2-iminobutanoate/2-iminopropanoate deaminase